MERGGAAGDRDRVLDAEPARRSRARSAPPSGPARAGRSAAPRAPAPPRAAPTSGLASGIGSGSGRSLERVLQRVDQRLPGGLDDVLRDADRAPLALAVGGVEQDPGDGAGAVVLVEDPDLVVGQLDVGQVRVAVGDRAAQGAVERVDRAVALGDAQVALAVDLDLDRRLGLDLAAGPLLGDDAEALELEQRLVAAGLAAQQQLEGGRRRLVVVAVVLALLQPLDRPRRRLVVELEPGLARPGRGSSPCRRAPRAGSSRSLPTAAGSMCSKVRASASTPATCMPPLWAKALRPT